MKLEQRIYCVEGIWDWGNREVEPSVEPMLQQMRNMGLWPYVRRDCATEQELEFYLKTEWWRCKLGSCLYLAAGEDHGPEGRSRPLCAEGKAWHDLATVCASRTTRSARWGLHFAHRINPRTLRRGDSNGPIIYPKHVHKALRRYLGIGDLPGARRFPFNNTEDFAFFG